jgi:iron complex outermembrane receptor protein
VELSLHGLDLSGKTLVLAPKTSAGAAVDWRVAHLSDGDVRLQLDGNYYSRQFFDPTNYLRTSQPGYAVANARTVWVFGPEHRYTLAAWVKNLTDREYYAYALPLRNPVDGGLGLDFSVDGEPRTFGVTGTVKF